METKTNNNSSSSNNKLIDCYRIVISMIHYVFLIS